MAVSQIRETMPVDETTLPDLSEPERNKDEKDDSNGWCGEGNLRREGTALVARGQ